MSGRDGFDFLHGRWLVRHRRLAKRLIGSTDWAKFGGIVQCRPILGGLGNIDENWLDLPSDPYSAVTLRLFEPAAERWSIRWIDGRDMQLGDPVLGGFRDGVGEFFGDDTHEGRPVRVRFRWHLTDADTAHWEQAFSADGDGDWETNWRMDFVREEAAQ